MKKPKVLFIINGMGLGNSTRCYAVIQELVEKMEIHVITSGNGLLFFDSLPEITGLYSLNPVSYDFNSEGKIRVLSTLRRSLELRRCNKLNEKIAIKLIEALSPSAVVLDSQYFIRIFLDRRINTLAINSAAFVVWSYLRNFFSETHVHFWFFEFSDFLFHKIFAKNVLVPELMVPSHRKEGPALLVRRGVVSKLSLQRPSSSKRLRLTIVLSGAINQSSLDPLNWNLPVDIDVVGRSGTDAPGIRYHGKVFNEELMINADILVVNGGLSSVTEVLALRKPAVVIPLPGHSEQYANAHRLYELGVALIANTANIVEQVQDIISNYEKFLHRCNTVSFTTDGARKLAEQILKSTQSHKVT